MLAQAIVGVAIFVLVIDGGCLLAAPDLRAYTTLTLYDSDATQLAQRAYNDINSKVPGLQLLAGNIETILIQAMALVAAETVYAINRVPNATLAGLLNFIGATADPGEAATANIAFAFTNTDLTVVPAGTTIRLGQGDGSVTFTTNVDVTNTGTTATVAATAASVGSVWNGTPTGTPVELLSTIPSVDHAALASTVFGGRDPEDTQAWLTRASARLRRLTAALVTADSFQAYALEQPGIVRALAIDSYDSTTGTSVLGHVTVAVAGAGGALIGTTAKTDLETAMAELAAVNLSVHVIDTTITPIDIVVEIRKQVGYDDAQVEANVRNALAVFLDPEVWPFDATVAHADLVAVINRAAGVQSATVTTPTADVALEGLAPLAQLSTTVTIVFAS